MGPAIAVASIVSSIAAAGMSAYSSMQSAAYNAQVARNNQSIANTNAAMALQQGTSAEENQRLKTGSMIGAIQSQEAASGVETNKGSALDVRSSAAETGELDAENIRYNANVQAWNLKNQANQFVRRRSSTSLRACTVCLGLFLAELRAFPTSGSSTIRRGSSAGTMSIRMILRSLLAGNKRR